MLPSPYSCGLGPWVSTFEATSAFTFVTAQWLAIILKIMPSIGFRNSVSLLPAIQATRLLTLASVGLFPTEHASLCWTHNRTCRFPASGFPTDFTKRHTQGRSVRHLLRLLVEFLLKFPDRTRCGRLIVNHLFLLFFRNLSEVRALRSPGITRLQRYYDPLRDPSQPRPYRPRWSCLH